MLITVVAIILSSSLHGGRLPNQPLIARLEATRIETQATHERLAWAEAARIQADADAELAAAVAAQRERDEAARLAAQQAQRVATAAQYRSATPEPTATAQSATRQTVQASRAVSSLEDALAASPWPPALWAKVEAVVACESGGQTTAVSPGGHVGLMQVDPRLHGPVPADAVGQLTQGYAVFLKQGWAAWSCA